MAKVDQFVKDINFNKVVFLHINRTGISIVNPILFIANVEFLEILLSPYHDDQYKKDIKSTSLRATSIAALDPMLKSKGGMSQKQTIENAVHNMRCLMSLAERKGLLLEKVSANETWRIMEEENEQDTTTDDEETT